MKLKLAILLSLALLPVVSFSQTAQPAPSSALVARVGDTGFVQLDADSFHALSPRQQALAYWLTQASIAIDPIIYDQLSRYGLRQKRLLEEIVAHPAGIDPLLMARIADFTELFWANRGNHNEMTAQKFLPAFRFEELRQAALAAQRNGAMKTPCADLPPIATPAQLEKELQDLQASLFDPDFEPMITAKSPKGGKDILQASSNTFYEGVSLADLKDFREQHPLNSRLVKAPGGNLREEVYRAGTPDGAIPPGLYATFLKKAIACLEKARAFADPQQAQVLAALIRYYQTGDFADWLNFGAAWVQDNATVDFANGFIEVYRDARGAKGSSQSFVSITDKPVSDLMAKLANNADYFEHKAPWDPQYKKQSFTPPVVKAVETLIETGDFTVSTIGDNLPNENEIHEKYGTKNFLFTGSSRAFDQAVGTSALEEFAASPEELARGKKYGAQAENLLTALHEVIGHGSGKLSARLSGGSASYLKEYFSTLEEARADLMALWNVWDPKLKELGLLTDQDDLAKTMYDSSARVALTQLRRIPKGDTIEEDHQRNRQLIVFFIMDKTPGAIEQFDRDGKTFIRVKDYQKMREGVGLLLAELMRIKAEGDYAAIKALVDRYAVHFNTALRDQIVARYRKLNLPTYWAGINADLTARWGRDAQIEKVEISYPRDPVRQYLNYAAMYNPGLRPTTPAH
ncbi:MAG: peptidase M49 [Acidobacteriia bacterium]|nr:peptidase M49 [Terriglobia bacterium]